MCSTLVMFNTSDFVSHVQDLEFIFLTLLKYMWQNCIYLRCEILYLDVYV
jgi:hypothetical protein